MRQRGFSLFGMLFVGVLVALVVVLAAKVTPTVIEYRTIQKAVNEAARQGTTVAEVRSAFDRAKSIDYFEAISGQDLEIRKVNGNIVIEFAYEKEIHLVGPAYLLLKYSGRSS